MGKSLFTALIIGLGMAAVQPGLAAENELSVKGEALAKEQCGQCHATGATGESPHKEAPPFRTFASKWPLENLEESLAEGIVTGHPDMPAITLEPDQITVLIEHLHTIATPDPHSTD